MKRPLGSLASQTSLAGTLHAAMQRCSRQPQYQLFSEDLHGNER